MPDTEVSADGVREQIEALTEANRRTPDPELERRLLSLRYRAGVQLCSQSAAAPRDPTPDFEGLQGATSLPEITPDRLTPELARAAILEHGALLVRGLVPTEDSDRLRAGIDRVFEAREARANGGQADAGYYEEFNPGSYELQSSKTSTEVEQGVQAAVGRWSHSNSGIWAADSPRLMFEMLEAFERVGLLGLARQYLGEPPAISMQKCTLRKQIPPETAAQPGWHQDGAFLGDVRALNVWLSLSHCGDDAPGLYLVPRRLDHIVPTGTRGAIFDWVVSPAMAEEAAAGEEILKPIFEPGDVMLFDELYLHATAADPGMSKPRYAVESWFFGPSAFPENVDGQDRAYVPLAT
jgi:hypothetical protein